MLEKEMDNNYLSLFFSLMQNAGKNNIKPPIDEISPLIEPVANGSQNELLSLSIMNGIKPKIVDMIVSKIGTIFM